MLVVDIKKRNESNETNNINELQTIVKALCKRLDYLNNKQSIFVNNLQLYNVYIDTDFMKSTDYVNGDYIGYGYVKNCKHRIYFTKDDIIKLYQVK